MRKLILMSMLLAAGLSAHAQYVSTGKVIDEYGNPISGAKVQGKGTSKYTTTGIDGTFKLETPTHIKRVVVTSLGKGKRDQKLKGETTIQMKKPNWFTDRPDNYHWFASAQVGLLSKDSKDIPFGVMGGVVKDFGVYAKILYSSIPSDEGEHASGFTGNYKTGTFSVTAGPIIRLFSPIHLYIGAGYVNRKITFEASDNKFYTIHHYHDEMESYDGFALEAGLMVEYKNFLINGGYETYFKYGHEFEHSFVHFGVGYKF